MEDPDVRHRFQTKTGKEMSLEQAGCEDLGHADVYPWDKENVIHTLDACDIFYSMKQRYR